MTRDQAEKAKQLTYNIDAIEELEEECAKQEGFATIHFGYMSKDTEKRWRDLNENFFKEEAERLKKELEAM